MRLCPRFQDPEERRVKCGEGTTESVDGDAAVRVEGDVVAFVDGDGTVAGHQLEHTEPHTVIGSE